MLNKTPITGSQIQAAQIEAQNSHEHQMSLLITGFISAFEKCGEDFLNSIHLPHSQEVEIIQNRALRETRAQAAAEEAQMHERADKVMTEIEFQHLDAMMILDIEHKARMITTLKGWWSILSAEDKADWFCAWDDYNFKLFTNPTDFDLAVFNFLKGHHHLENKKELKNA